MRSLCSSQASDGQPKAVEWKNRASFVCDVDTPNLFSLTVLFLSLFCSNLPSYSELLCSLLSRSCRITYDSPTLSYTNLCYSLSHLSLSVSLALVSIKQSSFSLSLSQLLVVVVRWVEVEQSNRKIWQLGLYCV